jgi:4-amino-4-deoxy-L-arabinose transferase-like glycosyltransferase
MPSSAERPRASSAVARTGAPAGTDRRTAPALAARTAPAPRREYWLRLLPLLALLTTVTRLPSFLRPLWNPDEGFLAVQARQLAAGGVLYDTVVDRKPPLMPWLYQGAFALFGDDSLWPLKAAAVVVTLVGAAFTASLARGRWGDRAGRLAGVLAVLLSIGLDPEDTQAASFEVFMVPCTAAALWCAQRRRWAAAGLAVALATLTKQTGGAALLPVLFVLVHARAGAGPLLRLLGAWAAPLLLVALVHGPGRFLHWTVTGSGAYASVQGAEVLALLRALGNSSLLALAALPLLVALVHGRRRRLLPPAADLWVWLGTAGAAVVTGFQFYGHYFLQLVPPLALLGTAALRELRPRAATAALTATALAATGYLGWGLTADRSDLDHARRVSAALRAGSAPGDPVLVWGMHPENYWLADRAPATRYLTAGFLTNYSGGRGGVRTGQRYAVPGAWENFRRDLAASRPPVIVDDSRGKPYRPSRIPELRRILAAHYERAGTVDGAVFWVRAGR